MSLLARLARSVFTARSLDRERTLLMAERMSAATHLVASLELLARSADRKPGGVNDWSVSQQNIRYHGVLTGKLLNAASDPRTTTVLHVARALSSAFLLAPTDRLHKSRFAANAIISTAAVGTFHGQIYGSDGSDQASLLVQAAATVARSSRDPRVVDAALWFLALQSTLNYAASGWVKMVSPTWRSGRALPGVMRTVTYGHQGAWKTATRFPRSAMVVGHAVLAMECLFPAVFGSRGRLTPAFVGSAAAFHVANGGLMGLGRFVGAFSAMHPAVLYATDPRRRAASTEQPHRRSDVLPIVAGAIAAAGLGTGLAAQVRRRRVVMRSNAQARRLVTGAGNTLTYTLTNPAAAGPVIFLETALAATDQHWEWIRRGLAASFTTVVYQRAGYGTSEYRARRGFTLADSTADFTDLVAHTADDRSILIAGHSLGGYLALRSAEAIGARVRGVALIDSSHPGELIRSARQAGGTRMLDSTLRLMAPSMRLGLGSLLDAPEAFKRLPVESQPSTLAQYRDPKLWSAAHREWKATRAEFDAFDGQLPKVEARILVLAAGKTIEDDPAQAELNAELGSAGSAMVSHVVADADHETIITASGHADEVVGHVTAFARDLREGRR
ncbi:alpha/beta fold hydrolase [Micromonospora sp. KC207]|uniref:alpha/beta fold hydrolase n=1 Tax=Micromonospora sp. KC207 TaxID=2530377 RepID=UPI001050BB25|nr:alpha/beta fold hydrolase [Micromonospora sp. KC207]TDC60921.1 alpha/beta fold hydrolase [Micromonospora sp. KC207]